LCKIIDNLFKSKYLLFESFANAIGLFQMVTSTTLKSPTTKKATRKRIVVTGMFFVKKMYQDLLTGYDTRVRPVQNQSKPVYVNTKFVPMALIDFDNANQKLSMMAYMRIHWVDEQIVWKPRNYAGRAGLRASLHEVWTPNVVLHKVRTIQLIMFQFRDVCSVLNLVRYEHDYPALFFIFSQS